MKRLTLLFIGVLVAFSSSAQDVETERIEFVKKFEAAVMAHDQTAVIKLTDKAYRKAQINFLDGDKTQFVDELFGGVDVLTDEYINLKFTEIQEIEYFEKTEYDEGFDGWVCVFLIKTGNNTIQRSLLLRRVGKKFGFIGSQG